MGDDGGGLVLVRRAEVDFAHLHSVRRVVFKRIQYVWPSLELEYREEGKPARGRVDQVRVSGRGEVAGNAKESLLQAFGLGSMGRGSRVALTY